MTRSTVFIAILCCVGLSSLDAQAICRQPSVFCTQSSQLTAESALQEQAGSFQRRVIHVGKWVTAAAAIGFTVMASTQHSYSRREWDALLELCRSAQDACTRGPDGTYLRADAEALYQRSRHYDVVANRWLVSAQLSLVTTTALFIIDLNAGGGPENIPYPSQLRVGAVGDGAGVEMRIAF